MREKLLSILQEVRPDVDFGNCGLLMDDRILDSFDIVYLIGSINEEFGVDIIVEHLVPDNFNSVDAILALIESMKG